MIEVGTDSILVSQLGMTMEPIRVEFVGFRVVDFNVMHGPYSDKYHGTFGDKHALIIVI